MIIAHHGRHGIIFPYLLVVDCVVVELGANAVRWVSRDLLSCIDLVWGRGGGSRLGHEILVGALVVSV